MIFPDDSAFTSLFWAQSEERCQRYLQIASWFDD